MRSKRWRSDRIRGNSRCIMTSDSDEQVGLPDLTSIHELLPQVETAFIQEHLNRMAQPYFQRFDFDTIVAHIDRLRMLQSEHPVEFLYRQTGNNLVACTVCAFDNPFVFSLITGILSSTGFNIQSGEVFTWSRSSEKVSRFQVQQWALLQQVPINALKRRRIVDFFLGEPPEQIDIEQWSTMVRQRLESIFGLMEIPENQIRARRLVTQMVTDALSSQVRDSTVVYLPTQIECDFSRPECTRMQVIASDTPFFLYSVSTALSLQNLCIEYVAIRTKGGRIEDTIDITTAAGKSVNDQHLIDRIKLSVLLTKQFTYCIGNSPDPYAALVRFETIVQDIASATANHRFVEMLSEPRVLFDLARLLGTSDYLWEDFIRINYESLIELLKPQGKSTKFAEPIEKIRKQLDHAIQEAQDFSIVKKCINECKDKQLYFINLDHILLREPDLDSLGIELTQLVELIVQRSVAAAYKELVKTFGEPKTIAGLPAVFMVAGLGKFGGMALGYGSDIELLFVYSDSGTTAGESQIANSQFFDLLVQQTLQLIDSKRDGIFTIDMRLRPYGTKGPLACSLESFCRYYGPKGSAHSFERLALVRLRPFAGDHDFGGRIERLRDEFVYKGKNIRPVEIYDLRQRQYKEKMRSHRENAKFSQGALVDLEYDVMLLQVMHGSTNIALRTPLFLQVLRELSDAHILQPAESRTMMEAYRFFRNLINGLRILRGSDQDLFLPQIDSEEYYHCARRMGYRDKDGIPSASQLHADFQMHTAHIRTFVERHFGRDTLPGPQTGNSADIILSEHISEATALAILREAGFDNPQRGLINIRAMARGENVAELFSHCIILAVDMLQRKPDPDMALNNWERFVANGVDKILHFQTLLSQPQRLDILLSIFSSSQWLAENLIAQPQLFDWVSSPQVLHARLSRGYCEEQLRKHSLHAASYEQWLDSVRLFRKAETLRIGIRDICLRVSIQTIMRDLSQLASAIVQVCFEKIVETLVNEKVLPQGGESAIKNNFCVVALGKLGGNELNYSSDIDLIGVYQLGSDEDVSAFGLDASQWNGIYNSIMERLCKALSNHTVAGYVYRVDTRLRPYGRAGTLSLPLHQVFEYYNDHAALWEIQALLKIQPIAGNLAIGHLLEEKIRPLFLTELNPGTIIDSIERMRLKAMRRCGSASEKGLDVKNCRGGIRDIEFFTQGLQLIHGSANPDVICNNTSEALQRLSSAALIPQPVTDTLLEAYIFLRRTEHFLQLVADRQVHTLPTQSVETTALAKRMMGIHATESFFIKTLQYHMERVKEVYQRYFLGLQQKRYNF
ncbi:MAG: hypothetical protein JW795_08405 [Chitinivibrionales bacterium]|nr:hypothetical protein [Chitinivibrionales bacterium]